MERTPYEVSFPQFGISMKPSDETAVWNCGFRARQCPAYPLHFTIAMTGCAFAILLGPYVKSGEELDVNFRNIIGEPIVMSPFWSFVLYHFAI